MKKITTIAITLTALAAISAPASAKDATFKAAMSYDNTAAIDVTYAQFKKDAAAVCKDQIRSAGYRTTESTSWQQRKCEKQIVAQAVKATKNDSLYAFHIRGGKFRSDAKQFAQGK